MCLVQRAICIRDSNAVQHTHTHTKTARKHTSSISIHAGARCIPWLLMLWHRKGGLDGFARPRFACGGWRHDVIVFECFQARSITVYGASLQVHIDSINLVRTRVLVTMMKSMMTTVCMEEAEVCEGGSVSPAAQTQCVSDKKSNTSYINTTSNTYKRGSIRV